MLTSGPTNSSISIGLLQSHEAKTLYFLSEAQAANAHGGRQASLGELRSSPVPGEAELGVPESEVAAAEDGQQSAYEHTISQRTSGADDVSTPYFIRRLL